MNVGMCLKKILIYVYALIYQKDDLVCIYFWFMENYRSLFKVKFFTQK